MNKNFIIIMSILLGCHGAVWCQAFDSGSDGSYGPLVIPPGSGAVAVPLPADGIIRATTVSIGSGSTLRFTKNVLNTPVFILSTGDVDIIGDIEISGGNGSSTLPGSAGPGGFDGGAPGREGIPPGAGFGPGAGLPGEDSNGADGAGGAGYATRATLNRPNDGETYGSPLLIPLIGGSGGGGSTTGGGGAGAGAILVASNTRISVTGRFFANGGSGTGTNGGSGGAVRLVAPKVEGTGFLQAVGSGFGQNAGDGRFRIDTLDHSDLALGFQPNNASSLSIGSLMVAIPAVNPRLDIIEAAGTSIPVGSGPVGISLPNGSSTTQDVVVQATDFEGVVDVDVVVTPENGDRTVYPTTIDMGTGNPAQATVEVEIPLNVGVKINCYSR